MIISFIYFILFTLVAAFLFARIEVAIEGREGWASNLPCFRLPSEHILSRLFFGGRPATGYHFSISFFIFFIPHFVFLFLPFSFEAELKILSFIFLFWVFEDFIWFLINPAYGIRNFRKDKIWWHQKRWFVFAPIEYFIFTPLSIVLYIIATTV